MTHDDGLIVERRAHVAVITMNRPHRHNSVDTAQLERLESTWHELDADADVRVIVFTGAGSAFCAGADLVARTATGAEVSAGRRLYGLVNGELMWAHDLAAFGQPLQSYASARLTRVES